MSYEQFKKEYGYDTPQETNENHTVSQPAMQEPSIPAFERQIITLGKAIHPPTIGTQTAKTIAVLAFNSDTAAPAFKQYIQDLLYEVFFQLGELKLFERAQLAKVLEEQSFQLSGIVDDSSAKTVGALIGVDLISFGTITELSDQIRVTGKTVDVESGEIVAISSVLVAKDQRVTSIFNQTQPAPTISRGGNTTTEQAQTPTSTGDSENNEITWQAERHRNEFDDYQVFTFTVLSAHDDLIFLGYVRHDDPTKSYVRAGVSMPGNSRPEIKKDDRSIETLSTSYTNWFYQTGIKNSNSKYFTARMSYNNHRAWLNLLLNNKTLTVRRDDRVSRFNTYGLQQMLTRYGISTEELDAALANEEF